jgi:hypothetical protein
VAGLPMTIGSGGGATNGASGFVAQLIPVGAGGSAPTLRWPLAAKPTRCNTRPILPTRSGGPCPATSRLLGTRVIWATSLPRPPSDFTGLF